MVDRDLLDDFFRAYAYFRWVDDFIDIYSNTVDEGIAFIERQKTLINLFYSRGAIGDLAPHEQIAADLIRNDRAKHSGLQSFIRNMMAIIEFDAKRKDRLITEEELHWYTDRLGVSVTDGIQYFVGNGHPYPQSEQQYLAATGAHIAHLLRDMLIDIDDGFVNIPAEFLENHSLEPVSIHHTDYIEWVRTRVNLARQSFKEGKRYLESLDHLRCKIVGCWYCARFEGVLETIEQDGYILRKSYDDRKKLSAWMWMLWIWIRVTIRHVLRKSTPIKDL
jgi:phytoene/squalene synthetase